MIVRQTDPLDDKAEGTCLGTPYTTELVNCDGVCIHFWFFERPNAAALIAHLGCARRHRDIVRATWSLGHPAGFWAHQNIQSRAWMSVATTR